MTENKKPIKIEFAPGCFDNFEGTQEELDEMVAEIHRLFESGEAIDNAVELDDDEFNELSDEEKSQIMQALEDMFGDEEPKRRLQ